MIVDNLISIGLKSRSKLIRLYLYPSNMGPKSTSKLLISKPDLEFKSQSSGGRPHIWGGRDRIDNISICSKILANPILLLIKLVSAITRRRTQIIGYWILVVVLVSTWNSGNDICRRQSCAPLKTNRNQHCKQRCLPPHFFAFLLFLVLVRGALDRRERGAVSPPGRGQGRKMKYERRSTSK